MRLEQGLFGEGTLSFIIPLVGPVIGRVIGDVISAYFLKPQDSEKRFNAIVLNFVLDPLYEIIEYIKQNPNYSGKEELKLMVKIWIEEHESYMEILPKIASIIASFSYKLSYIKNEELDLIPRAVSLPRPILSKYVQGIKDLYHEVVNKIDEDDLDHLIEELAKHIKERYDNSDIQFSKAVRRLISSEGIKLVFVARKMGLN